MTTPLPDSVLRFVLAREGVDLNTVPPDTGYVNNPLDPGGSTNYGVTQATYDHSRDIPGLPRQPVKLITYPEVRAIYDRGYWQDCGANLFGDVRPRLALVHFDWAFNGGSARSRRYLQSVVGVTVDGQIGPQALAAIQSCDEDAAVSQYLVLRAAHYHARADDNATANLAELTTMGLASVAPTPNATQSVFLGGWLARLRWCARATNVAIDPSYAKPA